MSVDVISIDKLIKVFQISPFRPTFSAVSNISLHIKQGEAFGFIGANGAGKSTTIKMLTGILKPSSGTVKLFGADVRDPEARRGVGYVPENPYLYDYLTPLEVLEMGMSLHNVKVNDCRQYCMDWLERFDIEHVANKRIRSFSKGMVQRTALAHSLAIKPRLLILDVPLSGLDPVGRKDVVDLLQEYRSGGGTLFFSSHVLHDVERIADRFGLIHRGELLSVSTPNDLANKSSTFSIRSIGENKVEGFTPQPGNRWFAEIQHDLLWDALYKLKSAGHRLIEVRPELTLETAFIRATNNII
jgi:ABC-2 type transport system ATP-binding protein